MSGALSGGTQPGSLIRPDETLQGIGGAVTAIPLTHPGNRRWWIAFAGAAEAAGPVAVGAAGGAASGAAAAGGAAVSSALIRFGCTTAPSRVRSVALTSSSSQLIAKALLFLSNSVSTKA